MLIERYERKIEGLVEAIEFRLLVRAHPELARLTGERQRAWAVWFAAEREGSWRRWGRAMAILAAGPGLASVAACRLALEAGLLDRSTWPIIAGAAAVFGVVLSGRLCESVRHRRIRVRLLQALRLFGHDVCERCGYDMRGHRTSESRRCPECGEAVPRVASRTPRQ